ncbi:MAG: helix-turn-helix transcriptional regulator [Acidobacteria bacterium]|nr:helix-turn-helix transcriptional regulator [Acidobacteriota bacterium]
MRGARAASNKSQAEVASLLSTSQGNLSRWERDLSYPQDADTLLKIESFVHVERSVFIGAVVASVTRNTRRRLRELFEEHGEH